MSSRSAGSATRVKGRAAKMLRWMSGGTGRNMVSQNRTDSAQSDTVRTGRA